jgi:hypothetical protein
MSAKPVIGEVKAAHAALYQTALDNYPMLRRNADALQRFEADVNRLLESIAGLAAEVKTIEDYDWLCDAILKWQIVFSSIFNIPRNLQVPPPPRTLEPPPDLKFFSGGDLEQWFKDLAFQQSLTRRRNLLLQEKSQIVHSIGSSQEAMDGDWYDISVIFAARVLEGRFNLALQIDRSSYWRLEEVWLSDVKRAKAYYAWERREDRLTADSHREDYAAASEELRSMLIDPRIKASAELFAEPQQYLDGRYLTDGAFDPRRPASVSLIRRKAGRIWLTTGETDEITNWSRAETYCRAFYDNIGPAVLQSDPERALGALHAFEFSKAPEHRYLVINAFETALAVYFLDAQIIAGLWKNHRIPREVSL